MPLTPVNRHDWGFEKMVEFTVNYAAVLVSAVVSMVVGMVWYGPLFGKKWIALAGISEKQVKEGQKKGMAGMMPQMVAGLISYVVLAYVLSMIVDFAGAKTAVEGAITGFWIWLGFLATTSLSMVLWEGKKFELYLLNNAYMLVVLALAGAIVAVLV